MFDPFAPPPAATKQPQITTTTTPPPTTSSPTPLFKQSKVKSLFYFQTFCE
jgi:hypothetical protein